MVLNMVRRSRRFKAGGSEYKWKIAENNTDLYVSAASSALNRLAF